jgi:hypothetical protein
VTTSLISLAVLVDLLRVARRTPPGTWVEVGVYTGGSATLLYNICNPNILHLFDTFAGIPMSNPAMGDRHGIGEFDGSHALDGLRRLMPDARFHVGVFPETLPDDLDNVAFAHIDCDQYQSVRDCITHLWPRMVPGGVMWFDDYGALWRVPAGRCWRSSARMS